MSKSSIKAYQAHANKALHRYFPAFKTASTLQKALRYSVLNGGKRLRPTLVYATGEMLGANMATLDPIAAAVELIHCYSLVHDDLPAMDDDDLRRGQPTCHIAFDEATAILVGDGLQAMAFELIADAETISAENKIKIIATLSKAIGPLGMVAGQALDMQATQQSVPLAMIETIHQLKTGALLGAAVEIGAITADCHQPQTLNSLRHYAKMIGLAFQIQDDILDVTSSTDVLGKTQGADIEQAKSTYVSCLGLDGAQAKLQECHHQAVTALARINADTAALLAIADYIIQRDH